MNKIQNNQLNALKILLVSMLMLSITRVVFWVYNHTYFESVSFSQLLITFIMGLRFDLTTVLYTNGLLMLIMLMPLTWHANIRFTQTIKTVSICINACLILLNVIDAAYFPFSGKRSGFEFWGMQKETGSIWLSYVLSYWQLLILFIGLLYVTIKLTRLTTSEAQARVLRSWLVFALLLPVFFIAIRGSFAVKPLNPNDASRIVAPVLAPLVLNTPFQMLFTFQQKPLQPVAYFDERVRERLYQTNKNAIGNAAPPNIVLIIIESLGKEYVGCYNDGKGYTPFLDSLAAYSMVYTHFYANGKKSIEGIPAIIAAMPSWMPTPYMNSIYATNTLKGPASYMKKKGYDVSFYHGGKNGTMSFDNLVAKLEMNYFGKNEFPEREKYDDGNWGIYDGPYLNYWLGELVNKPQPFFSTLFTLSSHHPYKLPVEIDSRYHAGSLPIHKTIRYIDDELKSFFASAQKLPWFKNTIFIITADHTAESENPVYQSLSGRFALPLFIYQYGKQPVKVVHTAQQIDLMSIILSKTVKGNYFSFGDTLSNFAMQYVDGIYQCIQWPYVYQFDGTKPVAFYNLQTDTFQQQNLLQTPNVLPKNIHSMDSLTKAVIQTYNAKLIGNNAFLR